MPTGRSRGRPPNPPPLLFWRIRVDADPPKVCRDHPALAELLAWQIALVRETHGKSGGVDVPLTGVRAHLIEDDGTKHRFLRRFGTAAKPFHGFLVLETEPPADARAILRIRGAELPTVAEYSLSEAEKVDKALHDQPAEQLARAAIEREDVRELLVKLLSERKPPPKKTVREAG